MLTMWSAVPTLNTVFDNVFRSAFDGAERSEPSRLAADVHETDTDYVFQLDVPGVKASDMEITLTDRTLEVRAARKLEREDGARSTARRSGRFHASYALPEGVDGESLSAHLEDGVLTIRVPKPAKAQPRRIEIRTGNEPAQLSR